VPFAICFMMAFVYQEIKSFFLLTYAYIHNRSVLFWRCVCNSSLSQYYCTVDVTAGSDGKESDSDSAKDSKQLEADLLKSELWTTVFRGGYFVRQLERSYSGRHVCFSSSTIDTH